MSKPVRECQQQDQTTGLEDLWLTWNVVLVGDSFLTTYRGTAMSAPDGVAHFLKRFAVTPNQMKEEGYRPLFLAYGQSHGGEEAESFGLFEKEGDLFEVHGTECSVWDFNGQWEPELTTVNALRHRLNKGFLGRNEGHDDFYSELAECLDKLAPGFSAESPAKQRSIRPS